MSYDLSLRDKETKEIVTVDHDNLKGGTHCLDGTNLAVFNITYNYYPSFRRVFGEEGIRSLYGKTALESLDILTKAINELGNDIDSDYWKHAEGNAKIALMSLYTLAKNAPPDSVWDGD